MLSTLSQLLKEKEDHITQLNTASDGSRTAIGDLEIELAKNREEMLRIEASSSEKAGALDRVQSELAEMRTQYESKANALDDLTREVAKHESDNARLSQVSSIGIQDSSHSPNDAHLLSTLSQLLREKEDHITQLNTASGGSRAAIGELEIELAKNREEMLRIEASSSEKAGALEMAQSELAEMRSQYERKINALEEERAKAHASISKLERDLKAKESEIAQTSYVESERSGTINALEQKLSLARSESLKLEQRLSDKTEELELIKSETADVMERYERVIVDAVPEEKNPSDDQATDNDQIVMSTAELEVKEAAKSEPQRVVGDFGSKEEQLRGNVYLGRSGSDGLVRVLGPDANIQGFDSMSEGQGGVVGSGFDFRRKN